MAKDDLIAQKMVRVTLPTHARLMRAAAAMQTQSGAYTSMDTAINIALDAWEEVEEIKAMQKADLEMEEPENETE